MKNNLYTPHDFFPEARDEAEVSNFTNNDIYKFLMQDFILENPEYRDLEVERELKIRTKWVRTAEVIPVEALKEQLDATKSIIWLSEADISFLRWMQNQWKVNFSDKNLFREGTLDFLKDFRLPDYEIWVDENANYTIKFRWPWKTSMHWEIFWLKIINSLYNYYYIKKARLTNVEFNQIINSTLSRLYNDIKIFKEAPEATFSEFGTRRSLSTDYQRMVFEILSSSLPKQCLGTSNVMLSREFGLNNPKWTNAHELRMIPTALYDDPKKIIDTMYDIDRQWGKHHPGLWILLPDTFGSSFYFENCPNDIFESHNGCRFDSKDPNIATREYVEWVLKRWWDVSNKIWVPSDWLTARSWIDTYKHNNHLWLKLSAWIWTSMTNNTKWTWPSEVEPYGPFWALSIVIKPRRVRRPNWEWVSTVKLSDNFEKAMWDDDRVTLFRSIFGEKWTDRIETVF